MGRPARPVSVCGGRTSQTVMPLRRSSRVRAVSAAVSAAFAALYGAMPAIGCSATTALS